MTVASGRPAAYRTTLTTRVIVLTMAAAFIAVVVAGVVAVPLVRGAAEAQAQANLARLADVVAGTLADPFGGNRMDEVRLRQLLSSEQVDAYYVGAGLGVPQGVTQSDVTVLTGGGTVSKVVDTHGGRYFLEGRPVGSAGVVLLQPTSVAAEAGAVALRRLIEALLVGLVIAALLGWVAARRVTRSLRDAAGAANRLSTGARDVTLRPEGPAEVAEIAIGLNRLSDALTASEVRQRDFFLSVSHELRTPLTAVKGYAEALSDDVVPPDEVPRIGAVLRAEAERLDRLVADLLDLARLGAADFRVDLVDVDLAALGREAADVWADRCAREGVPFRAELPATPLRVRTDAGRVRQIVDNLSENALRVTPAGAPMVLSVHATVDGAAVEVRDGGPGLTAADIPVAFEPGALYARYTGVRKVGSGVGLALVGNLAARLGGAAVAGTAPEGGARFTVTLPRDPVAAVRAARDATAATGPRRGVPSGA